MTAAHDPLILAMFAKLPRTDDVFTSGDRERWMSAMEAVLVLLYPPEWAQDAREKAKEARSGPVQAIRTTVTMDPDAVRRMTESWSGISVPFGPAPPPVSEDYPVIMTDGSVIFAPEEAPSTTFAGVVDDEFGGSAPEVLVSSPPSPSSTPSPPTPEPTRPSTDDPAPARKHFTADQKGSIVRRAVREDVTAVAAEVGIHESTLRRWMREMPVSVRQWEAIRDAEQLAAEAQPTVEELEAEKATPIPEAIQKRAAELAAKPAEPAERVSVMEDVERRAAESRSAVQWPTAPIERRSFDPDLARSHQAGQL